jgi:hypothetical protein
VDEVVELMARSRNIKPGFFTNDVLGELPPLARLLFAGIWTLCDREGRLEDRPKKIKAEVLPYDECDADDLLQKLHAADFIERYEVDGKRYLQVKTWGEHQNPHMKEAASTIPAPGLHGAEQVQAPVEPSPSPAPAVLIPDSLSPDSLSLDSLEEKAPRKRAASFNAEEIELPDWLDRELWISWCKERRTRGKAITERGAKEQLKALDEFRRNGHSPERVISHAIASGNQGLYQPPVIRGQAGQGAEARSVEVWKPPPPLTPEERAASQAAKQLALSSIKLLKASA